MKISKNALINFGKLQTLSKISLIAINETLHIEYINDYAKVILGLKKSTSLIGRSVIELFNQLKFPLFFNNKGKFDGSDLFLFNNNVQKWQGFIVQVEQEQWSLLTGFLIDSKEAPHPLGGLENNNTASKESINLNQIIENLPELVYWKDREGFYQGCNKNTAKLLNLATPSAIMGKTDYDFKWTQERIKTLQAIDFSIVQQGCNSIVEDTIPVDGIEKIFLTSKNPLYDNKNEIVGILGISTDITDRKTMEEELHLAKDKAEAANYIMTEFIANMGHDLATPISDVGSIAQMLDAYSDEYPELKELFEILAARANACEVVRKSIISATSISNLTIKPEVFSIVLELLALETGLRPTIGSKNVKLIIHPLKPKKEDIIETDRKKFHEILYDLLSNAINFTEEGEVTVSVLKEGELFHITVSDTGIGIPSDKFDYIFEQYTKLSRSNKYGATFKGVGAGLYLAKLRANSLNATISVESEVNKGSTFTLSIPATLKNS
ncbi:MAG: PAS domain-containing protein [Tatlockia sp.]|nr:PAS domain-containing protein [Tatlockia sp.]